MSLPLHQNNVHQRNKVRSLSRRRSTLISKVISAFNTINTNNTKITDINFNVNINEYFELILLHSITKPIHKRSTTDHLIISGYFKYLHDFITILEKQNDIQINDVLQTIANNLDFQEWKPNRIVIRNGEKGSKFYILLNGKVDVLIPQKKLYELSKEEYLNYLGLLLAYNEYELLYKVLKLNFETFPIEIIDLLNIPGRTYMNFHKLKMNKNKKQVQKNKIIVLTIEKLLSFVNESVKMFYLDHRNPQHNESFFELNERDDGIEINSEEYINRIKVNINTNQNKDNNNKYTLILFEYFVVATLETGQQFGDIALSDVFAKRTATIITKENVCYFGILNKQSYSNSIQQAKEHYRKTILKFILSTSLFHSFPITYIQNKFYNVFVFQRVVKDTTIININDYNDKLFILKDGTFEISMYASLYDISLLICRLFDMKTKLNNKNEFEMNNDIDKLTSIVSKIKEQNKMILSLGKVNEVFMMEYMRKFYMKVFLIKAPEVVGLNSYEDEETKKSLVKVKCTSLEGGFVYIDKEQDFKNMCMVENSLLVKEKQISYEKTIKFLYRLDEIRNSKLMVFFRCGSNEITKNIANLGSLKNASYLNQKIFLGNSNVVKCNTKMNLNLKGSVSPSIKKSSLSQGEISTSLSRLNSPQQSRNILLSKTMSPISLVKNTTLTSTSKTNTQKITFSKGSFINKESNTKYRKINKMKINLNKSTNNEIKYNKMFDIHNNLIYIDMFSIKRNRYINNRNVNLIHSTREYFLRRREKIVLTKRSASSHSCSYKTSRKI